MQRGASQRKPKFILTIFNILGLLFLSGLEVGHLHEAMSKGNVKP